MARYTEAKCRLCRREGAKLFLKGQRCFTDKCAVERRPYAPGQHGQGRGKRSDYGIQLREKQKVRRAYGLLEKQFKLTFKRAERMKGVTGENLLQLLERRLDNVVFRMGLAASRAEARQVVRHRHIAVNGRTASIPSFTVQVNDEIMVRPSAADHKKILERVENPINEAPDWLEVDRKQMKGKVLSLPGREHVAELDIQESLIIELYSK